MDNVLVRILHIFSRDILESYDFVYILMSIQVLDRYLAIGIKFYFTNAPDLICICLSVFFFNHVKMCTDE